MLGILKYFWNISQQTDELLYVIKYVYCQLKLYYYLYYIIIITLLLLLFIMSRDTIWVCLIVC